MKAREIRERLKNKVDVQVSHCLESLAEQLSVQQQQLMDMALMQDQVVAIVSNFVNGLEGMKEATESMNKIKGDDDDSGPTL
jgi:hypothetical protein|tara:strand:+ start:276 stop:521 length:246 start_codon:yes stop_codon:yes gene_type:complete